MQRIRWSQKRIAGSEEIERIACFELAEFGEFGEFAGLGELNGFNEFDECDECDERGNRRKGWEDGARRNVAGIGFLAEAKRAVDSKYAESVGGIGGIGGIQGIDVSDSLDGDFRRMEIWCVAVCLNHDGKNWRLYVWDVH